MLAGAVGSGKTALLKGLLGQVDICVLFCSLSLIIQKVDLTEGELFLGGKIAYAAQSAYILNGSLKENVLFGAELDEQRYNECIDLACLRVDINMLPNGDQTEIGEKGEV